MKRRDFIKTTIVGAASVPVMVEAKPLPVDGEHDHSLEPEIIGESPPGTMIWGGKEKPSSVNEGDLYIHNSKLEVFRDGGWKPAVFALT